MKDTHSILKLTRESNKPAGKYSTWLSNMSSSASDRMPLKVVLCRVRSLFVPKSLKNHSIVQSFVHRFTGFFLVTLLKASDLLKYRCPENSLVTLEWWKSQCVERINYEKLNMHVFKNYWTVWCKKMVLICRRK